MSLEPECPPMATESNDFRGPPMGLDFNRP